VFIHLSLGTNTVCISHIAQTRKGTKAQFKACHKSITTAQGWPGPHIYSVYTGLARTIYKRCIYGDLDREITKYTVIYGVYIRFWPTLCIYGLFGREITKYTVIYGEHIQSSQPYKNGARIVTSHRLHLLLPLINAYQKKHYTNNAHCELSPPPSPPAAAPLCGTQG